MIFCKDDGDHNFSRCFYFYNFCEQIFLSYTQVLCPLFNLKKYRNASLIL